MVQTKKRNINAIQRLLLEATAVIALGGDDAQLEAINHKLEHAFASPLGPKGPASGLPYTEAEQQQTTLNE